MSHALSSSRCSSWHRGVSGQTRRPDAYKPALRFRPLRAAQQQQQGAFTDDELQGLAEKIIKSDPSAAEKLQRIQEAAQRVAKAQAALKEFEQLSAQTVADAKAAEEQKIQEANDMMAAAEVQAAQKLMQAAELEVASADAVQGQLSAAARKDAERQESVKAGIAALAGGLVGSIPLVLASPLSGLDSLLAIGADAACALLFGVTYRYVIRQQLYDIHLKSGAVAAFAIVRGIGGGELVRVLGQEGDLLATAANATAYIGESFLIFAFAASTLEAAIQQGFVKTYGEDL